MKTRGFVLFTVFTLILLLPSLTLIAQQPRAVPPNDNFITAKAIQIGKNYSVSDIGAATNQGGEPTTTCRSNTVIPHSVWYTFVPAVSSNVYLTTDGSAFYEQFASTGDTVLAVFELTGPGTFVEVTCNDDSGSTFSEVRFVAVANRTYLIAVGPYFDSNLLPRSTVKLKSRMIYSDVDPNNLSFEAPISSDNWKLKQAAGNTLDDTIVCSDVIYPALDGICAFRFIANAGQKVKLTQTFPFPSHFMPRKTATLTTSFYARVHDTGILSGAKVITTVLYSDGTPPTREVLSLNGLSAGPGTEIKTTLQLQSAKVASIKFEVKFASDDGVLMIDFVRFFYAASAATRDAGALPVPPAAQ